MIAAQSRAHYQDFLVAAPCVLDDFLSSSADGEDAENCAEGEEENAESGDEDQNEESESTDDEKSADNVESPSSGGEKEKDESGAQNDDTLNNTAPYCGTSHRRSVSRGSHVKKLQKKPASVLRQPVKKHTNRTPTLRTRTPKSDQSGGRKRSASSPA